MRINSLIKIFLFLQLFLIASCNKNEDVKPIYIDVPLEKDGYQIMINENFDINSINHLYLNKSHWLIDENGWEESLLKIENGKLTINAETFPEAGVFFGRNYAFQEVEKILHQVSGVVHSQDIFDEDNGFLEIKARFPKGGENFLGSIMIMDDRWDEWPSGFSRFYASDTYIGPLGINTFTMNSASESSTISHSAPINGDIDYFNDFHTYGIEWMPGKVNFYFDGEFIKSNQVEWIKEGDKIYFMISIMMDKNAVAPERGMEIEYIRCYSKI